jgi:hypothetical protein
MRKNMRKLLLVLFLLCAEANAWQLNPSLVLNNPNTESCIATTYKVGDKIPSPIGSSSYSIIRSISGSSSRCQVQTNPNLANVEMVMGVSPKFQMEVPDEYKAIPINDLTKMNGTVLASLSERGGLRELYVFYRQREAIISPEAIMQATINGLATYTKEAPIVKNQEELIINGMKAWRYEAIGTGKTIFAPSVTYQLTMLEGDNEYLIINAASKSSNYEEDKQNFYSIAYKISGIKSNSKSEASVSTTESSQIENSKQKCIKLGFKEKTEKFGVCVLELIK